MKSNFSNSIIVRAALWSFVFMVEIMAWHATTTWHKDFDRFAIYTVATVLVVLATFRLGKSNVVTDFRDLCFYDVVAQCIGWYSYRAGYDMEFYNALTYAVLVAKFIRLLWPLQTQDGSALADWPIFGPFGYWQALHRQQLTGATSVAIKRQDLLVYLALLAIFPIIYSIRALDIKTPLAFWALIGVAIILRYFEPFLAFLDKRETEYHTNREKAAALAATESKNAELAQLNAQLEQAVREKDDALQMVETVLKTLATAAHDLRAPLTTINVRADAFERASDSERANAKLLLHSSVKYVCDGLDHAIHQAKLTNKLALPKIRAIFLPDVLRMLHTDWCDFAFEKRLAAFQVYPKRGCKVIVASDTWVLQRILRNLVVNAIEHSKPGNGIGMSIRQKDGRCLVRIWNTGDAIADASGRDREANFARLVAKVRANGYRSSASGHGLGLESVAQLCEVLGVKMGLYSRPKRGTVFGFALELASAELIAQTEQLAEKEHAEMAAMIGHSDKPLIIR